MWVLIIDKRNEVKQMVAAGEDASELIANGKSHGQKWLKGRHGKSAGSALTSAPVDPFLDDVTEKIKRDLEVQLEAKVNREVEAKVNRKVQDNMSMSLKKLAEAIPGLNLDITDYCATASSEDDENATPMTFGTST